MTLAQRSWDEGDVARISHQQALIAQTESKVEDGQMVEGFLSVPAVSRPEESVDDAKIVE